MPPDVGNADTNSDMHNPMTRMNTEMIGQPQAIAAGPPLFQPAKNVVKHPARIEMIVNEMAKFEKPDHERLSSCLYPSSARRRSSSFSSIVSATARLPRVRSCPDDVDQFVELGAAELRARAGVLGHA